MNEFTPLCLAVLASAVRDLHGDSLSSMRAAREFLTDEKRVFFFVELGGLSCSARGLRRIVFNKDAASEFVERVKSHLKGLHMKSSQKTYRVR